VTPKTLARRSRLEIIQDALAADEQQLEEARARFVELAAAEDEAVRESKRKDPAASPYALRAPAQQIRVEIEKLERTIVGLEKGLDALREEHGLALDERAEKQLAAATVQARKITEEESEAIRAAGALLSSLTRHWNDRVRIQRERALLAERVRLAGLSGRPELVESWEAAIAAPVESVGSFAAFVHQLLDAALEERPDIVAEHAAIDELNERRKAYSEDSQRHAGRGIGDLLPPIPKPELRPSKLNELVPDLRAAVEKFDRTAPPSLAAGENGQIDGLAEAGFGLPETVGYGSDGNLRLPWRSRSSSPEAA
jgi:hypothetical protein